MTKIRVSWSTNPSLYDRIMNLIFLLFLLMVVCDGCKREFKNEHGLKRHRVSCRLAKAHTATLLQQRQVLQMSIKKAQGTSNQDEESALVSRSQHILL